MDLKLKSPPTNLPPQNPETSSSATHPSTIPATTTTGPRKHYLSNHNTFPPPLISSSPFIPKSMTVHLMQRKKSSAIGVKFETHCLDKITDMEGALHTFVTPIVPYCEMVGDYRFEGMHGVSKFGSEDGKVLVRAVVMSASVHMDFETKKVMFAVCKLEDEEVVGREAGEWEILGMDGKQDEERRKEYDGMVRRHMVFHLTNDHMIPAKSNVKDVMSDSQAINFLENLITTPSEIGAALVNKFIKTSSRDTISLELLFNTAIQQARNEFSGLEALCPQGYIYTYNPPSIFAARLGSTLLNRLMLSGLKVLSDTNTFTNMRIFAFNDYTDTVAVMLSKHALKAQKHVMVMRMDRLFQGPKGQYDVKKVVGDREGLEGVREGLGKAMLVIHNNSDGFGQNVETEYSTGSLDGAIGANGSAAASLKRDRGDLVDFMF
jgi:hypothetical protein